MPSNEYYKDKMKLYRKRNPLSQKRFVYMLTIGDKKFAYLYKSDISIQRIDSDTLTTDPSIIKMF